VKYFKISRRPRTTPLLVPVFIQPLLSLPTGTSASRGLLHITSLRPSYCYFTYMFTPTAYYTALIPAASSRVHPTVVKGPLVSLATGTSTGRGEWSIGVTRYRYFRLTAAVVNGPLVSLATGVSASLRPCITFFPR
jgi:hypothetical protein